ncbi:hypothetical protein ABH15_02850 [Methanoculleus taiwanensis]|uniref:Uncharacterized protein n=1 Tax=Methanoculleus taiwanensis TaxID=1550565 RepID=A0A498H2D5_9EURY|nr:hypothetical protein [Methanoculleus taiwanensis]RXE57082.1 hypothetical protein ABH15_02850 [Methanoculleus taiwanensis]
MTIRTVLLAALLVCLFAAGAAAETGTVPETPPLMGAEDVEAQGVFPEIAWAHCYGGSSTDRLNEVQQVSDGGYVLIGHTYSNMTGDVGVNHGSFDAWVAKLTRSGTLAWQRCFGGSDDDLGTSVLETTDGGLILAGRTNSNATGDVGINHGSFDAWVVKLTATGTIEWQRCLGGSSADYGVNLLQTADGGYLLAGQTQSTDGDVSGNHGSVDAWIVRLTREGGIDWQSCFGGIGIDSANNIRQTSDGGYIFIGSTTSNDGNVSANHGSNDLWVVKLTESGTLAWQRCLGGTGLDYGTDIRQTGDGGYILIGRTSSNDGDVSGNHGSMDLWVVKLTESGTLAWQRCLGGSEDDMGSGIWVKSDGGYLLAGATESDSGQVTGNHGDGDAWLVELTPAGNMEWQRCFGGSSTDYGVNLRQTADGGLVFGGYVYSNNGDVSGNHGGYDLWVVQLGDGAMPEPAPVTIVLSPGWNFVSTPKRLAEGNSTASEVFATVDTAGHSIFRYDAFNEAWDGMGKDDPVLPLDGIWIYANTTTTIPLTFATDLQTPPTKELWYGWNAVGVGSAEAVSARDCFYSVRSGWATLISWNATEQQYGTSIINGGSGSYSDARLLYPTEAAWVFMGADGVLGAITA